jgi:branched-subunit amino acid transport protein AzlD
MRALALAVLANIVIAAALAAFRPYDRIYLADFAVYAEVLVGATVIARAIAWMLFRTTRMSRLVGYLAAGVAVGVAVVGLNSYSLTDVEDVSVGSVLATAVWLVPIGAVLGLILWVCERMASNNALERERGR